MVAFFGLAKFYKNTIVARTNTVAIWNFGGVAHLYKRQQL